MERHKVQAQPFSHRLITWAVALLILSACAPVKPTIEPPQVPDGIAEIVLHVPPNTLALTRLDMPAGFQLAAEKTLGPEYVALYLRPTALDPNTSGGNQLLSVLISIGVYTTTAEAEAVYLKASGDPVGQAIENASRVSEAATDIAIEPFAGATQGADASEAYRVTYRLMDQPVFEYGHRLRLGNVLAYVVVAAIGNPDEPQHLLEDTRNLVQRQINHIVKATTQTTHYLPPIPES